MCDVENIENTIIISLHLFYLNQSIHPIVSGCIDKYVIANIVVRSAYVYV